MLIKIGYYVTCTFDSERRKCRVIGIDNSHNPPKYEIRYPTGMAEWVELKHIEDIYPA